MTRPVFPTEPLYARNPISPLRAITARDEALSRVEVHSAPWRVVAYDALLAVARSQGSLAERRGRPEEQVVGPDTASVVSAKWSEHLRKRWSDPENRRRQSEQSRARWADPAYAEQAAAKIRAGVVRRDARRAAS